MRNIIIDHQQRDNKNSKLFNQIAFLLNCAIPLLDELKETTAYNKELKFHGNQVLKQMEKYTEGHQKLFMFGGEVQVPGSDKSINAQDIFNITDTAYEKLITWVSNRHPNHIVSLMTTIERMEASGKLDLNMVDNAYTPVDSDLVKA